MPGVNKQLEGVHCWSIEIEGGLQGLDHAGLTSHVKEFELYPKSNGKPFTEFWHSRNMIRVVV